MRQATLRTPFPKGINASPTWRLLGMAVTRRLFPINHHPPRRSKMSSQTRCVQGRFRSRQAALQRAALGHRHHETAPNSRKSVRRNNLSFPILSDTHNDVAAAFGLRFALPDYLVELYKSLNNDLPN